jgi:hypothetical protein
VNSNVRAGSSPALSTRNFSWLTLAEVFYFYDYLRLTFL